MIIVLDASAGLEVALDRAKSVLFSQKLLATRKVISSDLERQLRDIFFPSTFEDHNVEIGLWPWAGIAAQWNMVENLCILNIFFKKAISLISPW